MSIRFHRLVSMMLAALLLVSCTAPAAPANAPNTPAGAAPAAAVSTATTAPTKIPPTTAAPTVPLTNTPAGPASEIPLKDGLSTLQPQDVFTNFYQITQVPRPSGYMDEIRAFLVKFGHGLELETIVDDAGHVIIRDSPILNQMQSAYKSLFGVDAQTMAIHAGLECGAIGGIYPDMDMISIGPTLENAHTPQERLYIPSVQKVMDLLTTVLGQIPEAQK